MDGFQNPFGFPSHIPPPFAPGSILPEGQVNEGTPRFSVEETAATRQQSMSIFGNSAMSVSRSGTLGLTSQDMPDAFSLPCTYSSSPGTMSTTLDVRCSGGSRPISCPARNSLNITASPLIYPKVSMPSILMQGADIAASPNRLSMSPNSYLHTTHTQTASMFSQSNFSGEPKVTFWPRTVSTSVPWNSGALSSAGLGGTDSLANKIANSLSRYRNVPIKRKSAADEGSPRKVYLSEKQMAARMKNLSLSGNKRSTPMFCNSLQAKEIMQEIEDRLSSEEEEDSDDVIEDGKIKLRLRKDLKDKLTKQAKDEILPKSILEEITKASQKPSMEIVLWKPPGDLITDAISDLVKVPVQVEASDEDSESPSAGRLQSDPETSDVRDFVMDASDDVPPDEKDPSGTLWNLHGPFSPSGASSSLIVGHLPPVLCAQEFPIPIFGGMNSVVHLRTEPFVVQSALGGASGASSAAVHPIARMPPGNSNFPRGGPGAAAILLPQMINHQNQDNNNSMSQQDLFDALDDDMDL